MRHVALSVYGATIIAIEIGRSNFRPGPISIPSATCVDCRIVSVLKHFYWAVFPKQVASFWAIFQELPRVIGADIIQFSHLDPFRIAGG
jgi:hypothetical protein